MRLLNKRYRVEERLKTDINEERYLVADLWNKEKLKNMIIINKEKHDKIISHFVDNFLDISQVKHNNLLASERFEAIDSINLKRSAHNMLYMVISEYSDWQTLNIADVKLDINHRLSIILNIMMVIDYLNFRGYTYRYLSPSNIFYSPDGGIKLLSLSALEMHSIDSLNESDIETFYAPELFNSQIDYKCDYYPIGMIMKFLLQSNFDSSDNEEIKFYEELNLSHNDEEFLNNILDKLTQQNPSERAISLKDTIRGIISHFGLSFEYDLVKERSAIFIKTKTFGFDEEISKILETDQMLMSGICAHKGCIVRGKKGIGKTKFVKEVLVRLRLQDRKIYMMEMSDKDGIVNNNLAVLLNKLTKDAPIEILEKYLNDFSLILPDLMENDSYVIMDLNNVNKRYRIFNRISNFLMNISDNEPQYLIIENIERANILFIELIEYLLMDDQNDKLFVILTNGEDYDKNRKLNNRLGDLLNSEYLYQLELNNLNLNETEQMIKSILGMSYIPHKFSKTVYDYSNGNPGLINYVIKDLFNRNDLYISDDGCWEIKGNDSSRINFPVDIYETILNQLEKYSGDYRLIIESLSIYNNHVSDKIIFRITGLDMETLADILMNLSNEGVIESQTEDWGYSYKLANEELRRYVYNNLDRDNKIKYNLIAAQIMLQDRESNVLLGFDELVFHLIEAEEVDLALDIIKGEIDNLNNLDVEKTIMLLEKAYSLICGRGHKEELEVLNNLIELLLDSGSTEKAELYVDEQLNIAKDRNNVKYIVNARVHKIEIYLRKNQISHLWEQIRLLEEISTLNGYNEGLILTLISKARADLSVDSMENVLENIDRAIRISIDTGIKKYLGSIYNIRGIVINIKGNTQESINSYRKSIEYYESSDKPFDVIKAMNNLGNLIIDVDMQEGLKYYEEALEISKKAGMTHIQSTLLNNIGECYYTILKYKESTEYLEEARRIAISGNDYRLVFLTTLNLERINLGTYKLSKSYNGYKELEKLNEKNPILDYEILNLYKGYLAEFYFRFGDLVKADENSTLSRDFHKGFNFKEYFMSESRLMMMEYIRNKELDLDKLDRILNEGKASRVHDKLLFLLDFARTAIIEEDLDTAEFLYEKSKNYRLEMITPPVGYLTLWIETILSDEGNLYEKAEEFLILYSRNKLINHSDDIEFRVALGRRYLENKNYPLALRQFLEALDILYKLYNSIVNDNLRKNPVVIKKVKYILNRIYKIMKEGYNKNIESLLDESDNYDIIRDRLFNINRVINNLSKKQLYDILYYYEDETTKKTLTDVLGNMTDNNMENLAEILNFIGKESVAKRGQIIIMDEETGGYKVAASLIDGDNQLPEKIILLTSLRYNEPFIVNKNSQDNNYSRLSNLIPQDMIGAICVPIRSNERFNANLVERRRWDSKEDNVSVGYIYIETDSTLNRFDLETYKIIHSLSNVIYLNLENKRLKNIAVIDKVTGVYTRKFFEERIQTIIDLYRKNETSFSLLMLDIDKFKSINDTFGHQKGDEVLSILGNEILKNVRNSDVVGRYGGEEFIIILHNTNTDTAMEISDKIRKCVESIEFPGINRPITVSIGISQFPIHSRFKNDLIYKADQALYYAKEVMGRNMHVLWHPKIDISSKKTDKLKGIITGDSVQDNRNALALVDVSELLVSDSKFEDKVYNFLGLIINLVGGEYGSIIYLDSNEDIRMYTRRKNTEKYVRNININKDFTNKVISSKKGDTFIDWSNVGIDNTDNKNPNWKSVLISPLISDGNIIGLIYITTSLKDKEFDINNLNMCNLLGNIFAGNIKEALRDNHKPFPAGVH